MTVAGYVLGLFAVLAGAAVVWTFIVDASSRRNPANPRYCREPRCLRLTGHIGAHVDDSGRSWP